MLYDRVGELRAQDSNSLKDKNYPVRDGVLQGSSPDSPAHPRPGLPGAIDAGAEKFPPLFKEWSDESTTDLSARWPFI
jgi:hypothetical protein